MLCKNVIYLIIKQEEEVNKPHELQTYITAQEGTMKGKQPKINTLKRSIVLLKILFKAELKKKKQPGNECEIFLTDTNNSTLSQPKK